MCGIAGRILREYGQVGADLVELMGAQSHRGADSTGFAIYSDPCSVGYKVRLMGFNRKNLNVDLDEFRLTLKEHDSDLLEEPLIYETEEAHYSVRMLIREPRHLDKWIVDADQIADRIAVQSVGKSLEIIKDTGDALAVADKHQLRTIRGTHGLGHARLATESDVLPDASHPFWARPFPDVAIVHNGQITNYYTWRDRLESVGYRFLTENDSELIAVWISDQMKRGLNQKQALQKSIVEIDGVFTYMISDLNGIGFAKDRFAMKPLVTVEENNELTAATEEQAVRCVLPDALDVINYDGPSMVRIWPVNTQHLKAA